VIITSIPYKDQKTIKEWQGKHTAFGKWHEFRLDLNHNPFSFPEDYINDFSIITIRDKNESGSYSGTIASKTGYYSELSNKHNCLFDLELFNYKDKIISPDRLILSYHEQETRFDFKKIIELIQRSNSIDARFLKLVLPVNSYKDLLLIAELIETSTKPVLWGGLATYGPLSRILYSHLGAIGTYLGIASFPTASGQLTYEEAKNYRLDQIDSRFFLGGVIGNSCVNNSLGLTYYNCLFQQRNLPALYLPFQVDQIEDFLAWVHDCSFRKKFYGFSITMPFKKVLAERFGSHLPAINLYDPISNRTANTDISALRKALEESKIKADDPVLIVGSGAMAETALLLLATKHRVNIRARNKVRLNYLLTKYNKLRHLGNSILSEGYKLIINCRPLEADPENVILEMKPDQTTKIIDLPYTQKETPLIAYCLKKNIPYIDGKVFWQWQAQEQEKIFLENIKDLS